MNIRNTVNSKQFLLGSGALFIGLVEYILSRPTGSTYLGKIIGAHVGDFSSKMDIFGIFGGTLPDFSHAFAFALITMAIFPRAGRKLRGVICLSWLVVELFFEIGQRFGHQIAQCLLEIVPYRGVSDPLANYFVNGTYDHLDVFAICLGITVAYTVSELTMRGGMENDSPTRKQREKQRKDGWFKTGPKRTVLEATG